MIIYSSLNTEHKYFISWCVIYLCEQRSTVMLGDSCLGMTLYITRTHYNHYYTSNCHVMGYKQICSLMIRGKFIMVIEVLELNSN